MSLVNLHFFAFDFFTFAFVDLRFSAFDVFLRFLDAFHLNIKGPDPT